MELKINGPLDKWSDKKREDFLNRNKKLLHSMTKDKTISIQFVRDNAKFPVKATSHAAGYDVYAADIEYTKDGKVIVWTGLKMQPPLGYAIMLVPRSSLTKYNWVLGNSIGVGDPDFLGEYSYRFTPIPVGVDNGRLIYDEFPYKVGDRIGQMFLQEVIPLQFQQTTEFIQYDRVGGFGSTGK